MAPRSHSDDARFEDEDDLDRGAGDDWEAGGDDPDDADETLPCPYCGRAIYGDALRCPFCENYLSDEDLPPARKPWWLVLGVGLCLYLIYRWTLGR